MTKPSERWDRVTRCDFFIYRNESGELVGQPPCFPIISPEDREGLATALRRMAEDLEAYDGQT